MNKGDLSTYLKQKTNKLDISVINLISIQIAVYYLWTRIQISYWLK